MEFLEKKLKIAEELIAEIKQKFNFYDKIEDLKNLKSQSERSDFWSDPSSAQEITKTISSIESMINPILEFDIELKELKELILLDDQSLTPEIQEKIELLITTLRNLNSQKIADKYDDHDVLLSIYAGAGGTDAQDWAEMLLRMYLKWAEKKDCKVHVIDQSKGEEAGIKSATLEIQGNNLYGILKKENGVHRLVRLSPFNANNLRQTSFARVDVIPKIMQPNEIKIDEKDLKTDVFRSGGHGGQSVNTTDSAVRVTHIPTGITVTIQNERSQLQNKEIALTILKSKLLQLLINQNAETIAEIKGELKSAEWGNQIRSYVLHPYKQVKDLRSGFISSNPQTILDGDIDEILESNL